MIQLTNTVGKGGKNLPDDSLIAEGLLLQDLGKRPTKKSEVGKTGDQLASLIENYQKKRGIRAATAGLITPGDATWQSLLTRIALPRGRGSAGLGHSDYQTAANLLECEVEAVLAVAKVESSGAAFLPSGRPVLRFEAHIFSRAEHTQHVYDDVAPDISSRKRDDDLVEGGEDEYGRLEKAMCLNRAAALESASYGKFQIMGFNYEDAGFGSVESFVTAMFLSERSQLDAFVRFLDNQGLDEPLKQHRWSTFASGYNGPSYGNYDVRLKMAYDRAREYVKRLEYERFLRMEGLGLA